MSDSQLSKDAASLYDLAVKKACVRAVLSGNKVTYRAALAVTSMHFFSWQCGQRGRQV